MLATRMPMMNAVGTSLVVITALGLTTATSYAASGLVDWKITGLMIAGGIDIYTNQQIVIESLSR